MMQQLGVAPDVIDGCRNHVLAGPKTRRHYLHHDYAQEKHKAWERLGERIDTLLNNADVDSVLSERGRNLCHYLNEGCCHRRSASSKRSCV